MIEKLLCDITFVKSFGSSIDRFLPRLLMLQRILLRLHHFVQGLQQILYCALRYEIKVNDLRNLDAAAAAAQLHSTRARMSHQIHPSEKWPLFEFCVSLVDAKISRLHISTDLLIGDGRSFEIMFQELMQLYHHPETDLPALDLSFRDYLYALSSLEQTDVFRESREYWINRIPTLPPSPELPLEKNPASIARPEFKRRAASLEPAVWRTLKEKAAQFHSTPVGTLLAAYAEVLAIWSKNPHFTVNLTFNLEPVYGIILAFIVFKENKLLSKWFYIGFALIAIALVVHIFLLVKEERKIIQHAGE